MRDYCANAFRNDETARNRKKGGRMPSTIKEIADMCGCSKPTVTKRLRDMGLWSYHVTPGDSTRPAVVDDEATQMVAASITARRRPLAEAPGEESDAARLYEERIAELRAMLADQRAEIDRLRGQNEALASQTVELSGRVAEQAEAMKALPAPDAVERAREDGERDGREAGEAEGRTQEREKIAMMGLWKRRNYLKGSR